MITLKYRWLYRTGIKVSEIGFGCVNVEGLMIRGKLSDRLEVVRYATKLGISKKVHSLISHAYNKLKDEDN